MDTAEFDPAMLFTPIENAAYWLAENEWLKQSPLFASRALIDEGWRFFPTADLALSILRQELSDPSPSQLSEAIRGVFYSEMDAQQIMALKTRPKRQKQINALLRLKVLPLYEWPSCIRTNETVDAWVNTKELANLLIAGAHLPGMEVSTVEKIDKTESGRDWQDHSEKIWPGIAGSFPNLNKMRIAEKVAAEFKRLGVKGRSGTPSAETISRSGMIGWEAKK